MFTNNKIRKSPNFDRWPSVFGLMLIFSFGAMIQSCSDINSSASEVADIESYSLPKASVAGVNESEPVVVNNFEINFNGNTYDEISNTSTFSYTVSRGDDGTGFNYMKFEVPSCAELKEYSPLESSSITADGIEWTSTIGSNSSRDYNITYHGEVLTGMVDATIQASGNGDIETKLIPGPCKGVYSISGFIYVDENGNQIKNTGEGGIEDVTVHLIKIGTDLANKKTSSNGSYTFNVYAGSDSIEFKLHVRSASNSFLFDNFSPTINPPELITTVNNDHVTGLNLGFKAETAKIISDFETETIKLRTENPSFWADEFKFSDKGKSTTFPSDSLNKFLDDINTFLLGIEDLDPNDIFDFGGDRFAAAEGILTIKKNSPEVEQLRAELLAAMLNVVSGNGAVDEEGNQLSDFNDLILKTGVAAITTLEEELGTTSGSLMMNSTTSETTTFTTTSSIIFNDSGVLLRSFNGGGGSIGD